MINWRKIALKSAYKEKPFNVFEHEIASHATHTIQDVMSDMSDMSADAFWRLETTRYEVEQLQEKLKCIATQLGKERAAVQVQLPDRHQLACV